MFDASKYPMLKGAAPTCKECGAVLIRVVVWHCPDCEAEPETDAQLDERLTCEAEAAHERIYQPQ
jgi:predicted RNA-binding Zn-ribbon protein involved in translation (DUF1610 family)